MRATVGRNVRAIRQDHGLTADQLAHELRTAGLRWNATRVGELERGEKAVGVPELVALALSLSSLTGTEVTPERLVHTAGHVRLTPELAVRGGALADVLAGRRTRLRVSDLHNARELVDETTTALGERAGRTVKTWGTDDAEIIRAGQSATPMLADTRAAKRLGLTPERFFTACYRQWGHLLSTEIERRAGPGASAQARGHVTRELVDELREGLSRGHD